MATSMDVDSGDSEFRPLIDAGRNQETEPLAGGPSCSSPDSTVNEGTAKFYRAITIIEDVQKLIAGSVLILNKHQCKHIAERFSGIAGILNSIMKLWSGNGAVSEASGVGSSISEEADELVDMLEKGKALVADNVGESQGITNGICRANNSEAFEEYHQEFDDTLAKLGFQGLEDAKSESYSGMEKLKADAEEDKKENLLEMKSQKDLKHIEEKVEQVYSQKFGDSVVNVVELVKQAAQRDNSEGLPSYLTIARTELDIDEPVHEYVRQSTRDPLNEVGWARVYAGKWHGFKFAIKVFGCTSGDYPVAWNEKQLLLEAGSLVELQHPHVVRLVGYGKDAGKKSDFFVMELMDGDLRRFMQTRLRSTLQPAKPFTDSEELEVIIQIARGMYFIHTKGFAHGDLKCSNIMVSNRGQFLQVKIGDLRGSQKRGAWNREAFEKASKVRRPRWTAPEAIDHDGQNIGDPWEFLKRMDIYSFGMTCYEIVTGRYPFHGRVNDELALVEDIKRGWRPEFPKTTTLDERLKGLITSCWDQDPGKRPSFGKICQLLGFIKSKTCAVEKDRSCNMATWVSMLLRTSVALRPGNLRREDFGIPEYRYLKIEPEQLTRGKFIKRGSTAKVFKTTWLGCTFAEKELITIINSQCPPFMHEVESLIKVSRHPCMVQMVGLSIYPNGACSIITELMDGDLQELINTRKEERSLGNQTGQGPFDLHEVVHIISVIALGMAYLHSRDLVHGGLNSMNVLAKDSSGKIDVKIADFGMSTIVQSVESSDTCSEARKSTGYYTGLGTGFYRAPEMLSFDKDGPEEDLSKLGLPDKSSKPDKQALEAIDVYSFAMTCYEVLTGNSPLIPHPNGVKKIFPEVRKGRRPEWPDNSDPQPKSLQALKSLVERCWATIPKDRPTFAAICKDLSMLQTPTG